MINLVAQSYSRGVLGNLYDSATNSSDFFPSHISPPPPLSSLSSNRYCCEPSAWSILCRLRAEEGYLSIRSWSPRVPPGLSLSWSQGRVIHNVIRNLLVGSKIA